MYLFCTEQELFQSGCFYLLYCQEENIIKELVLSQFPFDRKLSYTKANTQMKQMSSNNYSYYCILSYPLRYLQGTDIIWLHFLHIIFMSG